MIRRARSLLFVSLVSCAPPAQSVGGWTSGASGSDTTSAPNPTTTTDVYASSSGTLDPSTSSSESSTTGADSSSTAQPVAPPWIVFVGAGSPPMLRVRALDDGDAVDVCALQAVPDGLGFLDDGTLVASFAATATISRIDPCDCTTTSIGAIEPPLAVTALTELDGAFALGVDLPRAAIVTIDLDTPALESAIDFADSAAIVALAFRDGRRFALRADTPMRLLELDDAAVIVAETPVPGLGDAVGLTPSPTDDGLLACDAGGTLWQIDPSTGDATELPPGLGACASLATPHGEVGCIDALLLP